MSLLAHVNAQIKQNAVAKTLRETERSLTEKYREKSRSINYGGNAAFAGLVVAQVRMNDDSGYLIQFTDGTYVNIEYRSGHYDEGGSIECTPLKVDALRRFGLLEDAEAEALTKAKELAESLQKRETAERVARQSLAALPPEVAKQILEGYVNG